MAGSLRPTAAAAAAAAAADLHADVRVLARSEHGGLRERSAHTN
jgi:hypothetical protein